MRKERLIRLAAFLAVMAAAAAYPVCKIASYEFPSEPPAVYRFRSGLVDPYDPFRGRYVALNPLPDRVCLEEEIEVPYGGYAYAVLGTDREGFASVEDLRTEPADGRDCVKVRVYGRTQLDADKKPIEPVLETKEDAEESPGGPKPAERHRECRAAFYSYAIRFPFDRYYMNEKIAPEAEKRVFELSRSGTESSVAVVVKIYKDGNYSVQGLETDGRPIEDGLR